MSVNNQKECGCKGIRTCLICEKSLDKKHAGLEGVIEYKYCHLCNLCWRVNENGVLNHSDHIGESFCLEGIRVVPEFVSTEEEKFLVSNIDQISWRPSQSGRRKQDFGPKVNFKKQKVKAGSFNGFPQFIGEILLRLNQVSDLYSFRPVELCNLEYCPERGSAIDPHLDDSWLWGERLVTLNLLSETVLTLSPTETNDSKRSQCFHKATDVGSTEHSFVNCTHFDNNLQKVTSDNWNVDPLCGLYKKDVACNNLKAQLVRDTKEDHSHPNINCCDLESLVENHGDMVSLNGTKQIEKSLSALNLKYVDHSQHILNQIKILVRINLPPRSLLVLSGCARHHWYHAINREDITSRRLAMTFRELSVEFLEGGKEWDKGKELLDLAKISDQCN